MNANLALSTSDWSLNTWDPTHNYKFWFKGLKNRVLSFLTENFKKCVPQNLSINEFYLTKKLQTTALEALALDRSYCTALLLFGG